MTSVQSEDGKVVANRYILSEELGRGGMGAVWRGWDTMLDREVAIKEVLLPAEMGEDERMEAHERVRRESRSAARLADHPNVITLHDVFDFDGHPWVVMQLVRGKSLEEVVRDEGPLPPERLIDIAAGMVGALDAAHKSGVLHRDVKPGNVMIAEDGRALLTDFGIAQIEGDTSMTRTGLVAGSPEYIAPERLDGAEVGPPSDLWSLGVTLYKALAGHTPFNRDTITAIIGSVVSAPIPPPPNAGPLTPVIMGLLERDQNRRLTAEQAKAILASPRHPSGPQTPPTGPNAAGMLPAAAPHPQLPPRGPGATPPQGSAPPRPASDQWAQPPGGYTPHGPTPNPAAAPAQGHYSPPPGPPSQPGPPGPPTQPGPAGRRHARRRSRTPLLLGLAAGGMVLALMVVAGMVFLANGSVSTDYASWEEGAMRVDYPADWEVDESLAPVINFDHPEERLGLGLQISQNLDPGRDVISDITALETDLQADTEGFQRTALESFNPAGFDDSWPAAILEGTWTATAEHVESNNLDHDERFVVVVQVLDVVGGASYRIIWVGPRDQHDQYRDIIEHTIDSFAPN